MRQPSPWPHCLATIKIPIQFFFLLRPFLEQSERYFLCSPESLIMQVIKSFYTLLATHSGVLAWRIPGTGEPGGLPSMGSQSRTRLKRLSSSSSSECVEPTVLRSKFWVGIHFLCVCVCVCVCVFNWRIVVLQCCVGFCPTTMWISHQYTCAPSFLNLLPPPHPNPCL